MKSLSRRQFVSHSLVASAASVPLALQAQSLDFLADKPITRAAMSEQQKFKLMKSVLDVLETHYGRIKMQFWEKPFAEIDFEKRLTNIIYWVDLAIQETESVYAIDPIWVVSQIMAESLFCELAISKSLAAGICQFMPETAVKSFDMVIAGSRAEHHKAPFVEPQLADALDRYHELRERKFAYKKATRSDISFNLQSALQTLAEGGDAAEQAEEQLQRLRILEDFDEQIDKAKEDYLTYVRANIAALGNNDIFGHGDFFVGFDERFTYKKPIYAMVSMLANALRVRNGSMLAAGAAYNAGLSRTWTSEALYTRYGKLPNINETSQYLSRIVANYEEIALRYTS